LNQAEIPVVEDYILPPEPEEVIELYGNGKMVCEVCHERI
jgi:hypothetical protein